MVRLPVFLIKVLDKFLKFFKHLSLRKYLQEITYIAIYSTNECIYTLNNIFRGGVKQYSLLH